jgi:predicted DNA-binding transcriptional regulator AlpA
MFSTRQAAKKLGITHATLSRYISVGKLPEPNAISSGGMTLHLWREQDIERVRQLLPKIVNGRKTRYKKKQSAEKKQPAVSTQQSVKPKKQTKKKSKPPRSRPAGK